MSNIDLVPATTTTAAIVAGVREDQLAGPTPCPDYSVADLLDHLAGLSVAFSGAARKDDTAGGAPDVDGSRLLPAWRTTIPAALADLGRAWHEPGAFDGLTMAGPVELPADLAALVALNEVVVHGWDLARATGQGYEPDGQAVLLARGFAESFEPAGGDDGGLFGPPVPVSEDAPELDRLLGATGRRPNWPA